MQCSKRSKKKKKNTDKLTVWVQDSKLSSDVSDGLRIIYYAFWGSNYFWLIYVQALGEELLDRSTKPWRFLINTRHYILPNFHFKDLEQDLEISPTEWKKQSSKQRNWHPHQQHEKMSPPSTIPLGKTTEYGVKISFLQ